MKRKFAVRLLCVGVALLFAAGNVASQEKAEAGKVEKGVPALLRLDVAEDGSVTITPLQDNLLGNAEASPYTDESTPPQEPAKEEGLPSFEVGQMQETSIRLMDMDGTAAPDQSQVAPGQKQMKEEGVPSFEVGTTEETSIRLLQMESIAAPDESQVAPAQEVSQLPAGPDMMPYVAEEQKTPTTTEAVDDPQPGKSLEVPIGEIGPALRLATPESEDLFKKGPPIPVDRTERFITAVSLDADVLVRMLTGEQVAFERTGEYFILDGSGLDLLKSRGISYVVVGSDVILKQEPKPGGDEESPTGGKDAPSGLEDAYLYGYNNTDVNIPDLGYAWSGVTLSGASTGARVTRVDYRFWIYHTYPGDLQIYLWNSSHQTLIWNRLGGPTDGGYDDDPESDDDIYMNWRTTTFFNNDTPNRLWTVDCYDRASGDVGYINYIEFRVWYTVGTPNLSLYLGTGSVNTYSYNSSTHILNLNFSLGNLGTAAAGLFYNGVYLSTDNNITTTDRRWAYVSQNGLAAGYYINRTTGSVDLDLLSPVLPAGTYYIGLIIDVNNQVAESNENDNRWYWTPPIVYAPPANLSLYRGAGSVNTYSYNGSTHVLNLNFSVGNFGTGAAGLFYNGAYLSTDAVISTTDRRWAYVPQNGLAGGYYINKTTGSVDLDLLSPLLPAGTYYIGLIIDVNNQVAESNEADNRWYWTPTIYYPGAPPNLSLYRGTGSVNTYSYSTSTHILTLRFSVGNFGTGTAGIFYTGAYLSTDNNITTTDRRWAYVSQASLAGGYYVNKVTPAVDLDLLSPSLPAGTYYIGVIIDVNNQVAESNEGDNRWYWTPTIYYPGAPPNLSLYRGAGSVNTYSYSTSTHVLTLRFSVGNFGTGTAGLFYTGAYLSTDNIISTTDRRWAYVSQASLAGGLYVNKVTPAVDLHLLSPGLPAGTYYIGVIIDVNNQVAESNEGDNRWFWTPTIVYTPPVNLSLYRGTGSVNTYTYSSSTHLLTLRFSVGNFGSAAAGLFYTGVYLSTDNIISTTDRRWAYVSQASLAGGFYVNKVTPTVDLDLLSPSLPVRTYYIGVIIDVNNQVAESNEGDNRWFWTPTIYYGGAGLAREGVEAEVTTDVPTVFSLMQNYPNPFNPSTTIRYALPQKSSVTIMVYNARGQEVTTLVQSEQEEGYHEVSFDASGLSSGVYFYRLQAGDFVQTRQFLLLK